MNKNIVARRMKLTEKQNKLLEFVKECHTHQIRKYTGEPYWTHPYEVAKMVQKIPYGVEVALCHDLIEDTTCTLPVLILKLDEIGYNLYEKYKISASVMELTDVYTTEAFPGDNRSRRKTLEAARLSTISPLAQSVKYADLIHNTSSICENDMGFAPIYLSEKKAILKGMRDGDFDLYLISCYELTKGLRKIKSWISGS